MWGSPLMHSGAVNHASSIWRTARQIASDGWKDLQKENPFRQGRLHKASLTHLNPFVVTDEAKVGVTFVDGLTLYRT